MKLLDTLMIWKVYAQRSLTYANIAGFAMMLFIFLSNIDKYLNINIMEWYFLLAMIGFVMLVVFGYLEEKFGMFNKENEIILNNSPQIQEILKKLESMENNDKVVEKDAAEIVKV